MITWKSPVPDIHRGFKNNKLVCQIDNNIILGSDPEYPWSLFVEDEYIANFQDLDNAKEIAEEYVDSPRKDSHL